MRTITDYLIKEELNDETISLIQKTLNQLASTQSFDIDIADIKGKLLTRCAGYLIEEWIKEKLPNIDAGFKEKFKEAEDSYYDFIFDNTKVEVKSFQKGKKYSNTKLTASQVKNINDLLFILVEYSASDSLNILNVEVAKGSDLKIKNDRLVKN